MDKPFLLMVAGPNGAGKTTLTQSLRQSSIDFGEYINPDVIAAQLQGSYEAQVAEAQLIADRKREACLAEKRSFSFETVMSHPSKVDILVRARAAGFFVQLYFVGTDDPGTNVQRVALRVAQGGHDVPRDRIVARWRRTMELLHRAIEAADRSFIFDNSATEPLIIGPSLVLDIAARQGENQKTVRRFGAAPDWVRRYILDRIEMDVER